MSDKHLKDQLAGLFSGVEPLYPEFETISGDDSVDQRESPGQSATRSADLTSLVTFRLGRQIFALPIEPIVQIVEMVTVTPLPQASDSLEGVINVRGVAVPVINLPRHFGTHQSSKPMDPHIILVKHGDQMVGLIVDQVLSVLDLSDSQFFQTVDMIPHELGDMPLLQGLVFGKDETVLLLDLAHLLLPQHRIRLAAAILSGDEEE